MSVRTRLVAPAVFGIVALALIQPAFGQSPTPTEPGGPSDPPAAAIHCARPASDTVLPELAVSGGPELSLKDGVVTVRVPEAPTGVTCYSIWREPSGVNPVAFKWDEDGLSTPIEIVDPYGVTSANQYCYHVVFGNRDGHSGPSPQACIDIPETIASPPSATPTVTNIPPVPAGPPNTGQGMASTGNASVPWLFALGAAVATALGATAVLAQRRPRE